jgi:nucleoside-diphosphate-sugar epimerase
VLLAGCGYSALAIARALRDEAIPVFGTTRHPERFAEIEAAGATPVLYGAGGPLPHEVLAAIDTVVDSMGPPWSDEPDPTPALLASLHGAQLRAFVYLSSTAVYGDHHGALVDEDSECRPTAPAGIRRLAAESHLLREHAERGLPVRICRLPGIYGPGRSLLDRVRQGRFRVISGQVPLSNRIHVDDIARGVLAAIHRGAPGRVYLICDGNPAPLDEVGRFASELVGVPLPPALTAETARATLDPSTLAMLSDSKRLSNRRMREELGVEPLYPSYREGLTAIFRAEKSSQ